jgi:hypothetical protein
MDRGGTSALSERRADLELKLLIPVGRVLHDREAERQLERADRRNPFETRAVAVAQAVGVVSTAARTSVMAGASYKLGADLSAEQAVEYSWANHYPTRAEIGFGWAPGARQVLNVTYRYTRANSALDYQPVNRFIVSGQWPPARHFVSVARVNYDMSSHRLIAALLGLQYDSDCWSPGCRVREIHERDQFDDIAPHRHPYVDAASVEWLFAGR